MVVHPWFVVDGIIRIAIVCVLYIGLCGSGVMNTVGLADEADVDSGRDSHQPS